MMPDKVIRQLGENAAKTIEKAAYDAFKSGTGVFYVDNRPVFDGPLIICPAADPTNVSCGMCSCSMVHIEGECGMESVRNPMPGCGCPKECQPIDQDVACNVLCHPGSKTYNQMWGADDDPEPWDD